MTTKSAIESSIVFNIMGPGTDMSLTIQELTQFNGWQVTCGVNSQSFDLSILVSYMERGKQDS